MAGNPKAYVLENGTIALDESSHKVIHVGDRFSAFAARGRIYNYRYLGIQPDECGFDLYLHNETANTFLNVEPQWFDQRRIILKNDTEDASDDGTKD